MITIIISILSIFYIIFIYFLLLTEDKPNYNRDYYKPVSVIIPCYNEDFNYLISCVRSIFLAEGDKQIILVNNNSNNPETLSAIEHIEREYKDVLIINESRQGKRYAHSRGLSVAKYDLIMFVDSDTLINKESIKELAIPFQDDKVGGVTGQMILANKNENFLTKSINAMFWTSCNIFRRASASAGFMQVIPGAMGMYKKKYLLKLKKDYLNQTFLGNPVQISDDRWTCMRIQTRFGKKIKYVDRAIAYTFMPSTFIGFFKTLERWKRGMIREVLLLWKEPKTKSKLLFFDTQFNFILFNFYMFYRIIRLPTIIYLTITLSLSFQYLVLIAFWLVGINALWSSYMLIYNPKEFPYKVLYSFFREYFFAFSYFWALINIRNQGKWRTR